ncbi:MAG TPA: beta-L-arabinofuranosidase domain-containing protein, partial [Bacillota bacterium]|nr:beta-L-arabinofuranosidase domain-containing protein [Bacillota bacterium]
AKNIHQGMARWDQDIINWHNVNLAQGFRAGTVFWPQSKNPSHLASAERNYQKLLGLYGQFPGGGFVGDENCRPGYSDPRGGIETCGITEFMHSFEMLTRITGNPLWLDRCEDIAFNTFPASMPPDQKGLHYITAANQIQLDRHNKSPGIQNGGTMFSYSPFEVYRCCQHNVSHGWPYFAEELWLATPDRGLCASLYAASEVSAKVGAGATVRITEETDYPFSDTITFRISTAQAVKFPLYLRLPGWCARAAVKINDKPVYFKAKPLAYVVLDRSWNDGDTVSFQLPMQVSVRRWAQNNDAASVHYGPLAFSLKIGERWSRYGGRGNWPEFEVYPTTPWNYGLMIPERNAGRMFQVVKKAEALAAQPFTPEAAPIELVVQAKKIPAWKQDSLGLVGKLQPSPVKSDEPLETVTLIPMGAARLRITAFPVIGKGKTAREWIVPKPAPVSASHCFGSDTVEALMDGKEPKNSNDHSLPRFTWWDHRGSEEWVQRDFDKPRTVSSAAVYWYDDTGAGSCRVPQSWRLLYKEGDAWKPVAAAAFGTARDAYNQVTFKPIQTTALRIEVKLQPEFSGGILEWKVGE